MTSRWEGRGAAYYRCGGDQVFDKTKILTALDVLPAGIDPIIHLVIHAASTCEELKATL